MPDLTTSIRHFDAAEANLKRLEELWREIEALIPTGMVIDTSSPDAQRYADKCRTFRHIRKAIPKLDDFDLEDDLLDLDDIFQSRFDAAEAGEISYTVTVERHIYGQGEALHEYRFRLAAQRRALVRSALTAAIGEVDSALAAFTDHDFESSSTKVTGLYWDGLKHLIAEIDVLRGTAITSPARWSDLHRHLHFGLTCDLHDIINLDWPDAKESLQTAMYGPDDPIPVEVADLGVLAKTAPTGPVVTALKWDALDAEGFERLVYNLVSDAPGYDNPQWLTHTNAPDRGRDISVTKTINDVLSGSRVLRVILQCKHWPNRGIGMSDVTNLVNQMVFWEPPRVDELVIATTGKFTSDSVDWIEKHNNDRKMPLITMWANSHLEILLANRPHLVAKLRLR